MGRYVAREAEHSAALLNDSKVSPLKRIERYFLILKKIYGQSGPIPGCMMCRFSVEIAEDNPSLKKEVSSGFAHWQYTIVTVIQQAGYAK